MGYLFGFVTVLAAMGETLLGQPLVDVNGMMELLAHFVVNMAVIFVIVQFMYYPKSKRRDYYFSYILMSICIFMLVYLLGGVKMKVGVALSLFAIFGIIRYRTEGIPIREMTYLFLVIALSAVNGLSSSLSWAEIGLSNFLVLIAVWLCESHQFVGHNSCKYVKYDNIELILPEKRKEMIVDLEKRTGLKISRIEVGSINFLNDSALIKVYYEDNEMVENTVDAETAMPKLYE